MYYRDPNSNLAYLPIHKNASTTFSHLVQRAGWKQVHKDVLDPDVILWGHIQNPWTRYVKGMAQVAWLNNERSFTVVRQQPFFKMAFLNPHLLPISVLYPHFCNDMKFIPMDATIHCNQLTNEFLEEHGSELRVSNRDMAHVASTNKNLYQKEVSTWMESNYPYKKIVLELHARDFELYRQSMTPFIPAEPNWLQKFLKRIWTSA